MRGESRAGGRGPEERRSSRQAGRQAVDRRLAPKARLAAPHALNSRAHRGPAVSGHG